jgi:tape measure domain-containing protein
MTAVTADSVVVELQASVDKFNSDVNNSAALFEKSMDRVGKAAKQAEDQISSSVDSIKAALLSIAGGLGLSVSIAEVQSLADEWTRYTNSIKIAGQQGQALLATQVQLLDIANQNGVSLENISNLYRQVSIVGANLNLTDSDRIKIAQGFSAAIRIQGLSQRQATYATLEFSHAIDEGTVKSRQFNALAIELPVVLQAVARNLGIAGGSIAEFRKQVVAGKVSSEDFAQAFIKASKELQSEADTTQLTIGASFTILRNNLTRYIGDAAQATGASSAVSKGIIELSNNLDSVLPALIAVGGALAGRYVAGAIAAREGIIGATIANGEFIAKILSGERAINETAEAHQTLTGAIYREAQAQAAAAAEAQTAIEAQIAVLREEAEAYETNIALAAQQRAEAQAAAAAAREQAAANAAAGFANVKVGAGGLSSPGAGQELGEAAEANALGAQLNTKQALVKVNAELAEAEQLLATAIVETTAASSAASLAANAYKTAVAEATIVSQIATVAVEGLNAVLAFFGGGVGIAIIAIVVALTALSDTARKTNEAVGNAAKTLQEISEKAEESSNSSDKAANSANKLAGEYDGVAEAADKASIAIDKMNASQREQLATQLKKQISDINTAISNDGITGPFTTDLTERAANARRRVVQLAGGGSGVTGGFADNDAVAVQRLQGQAAAGQTSVEQNKALAELQQSTQLLADAQNSRAKLLATQDSLVKAEAGYRPPQQPGLPEFEAKGKSRTQQLDDAEFAVKSAEASQDKAALRAAQEQEYILKQTTKYQKDGLDDQTAYNKAVSEAAKIRQEATASDARAASRKGNTTANKADDSEIATDRAVQKSKNDQAKAEETIAVARGKAAEAALDALASDSSLGPLIKAAKIAQLSATIEQVAAARSAAEVERDQIVQAGEAAKQEAQLNPRWTQAQKDRVEAAVEQATQAKLAANFQSQITAFAQAEASAKLDSAKATLSLAQINLTQAGLGNGSISGAASQLASVNTNQDPTTSELASIEANRVGTNTRIASNARSSTNPGGYSPSDISSLTSANNDAAQAQQQKTLATSALTIKTNQLGADSEIFKTTQAILEDQTALAKGTSDRRAAELELLALQQTEQKAVLESILAREGVTEATKERARQELATLQDLQKKQVNQKDAGPLQSYISGPGGLNQSPSQLNDSFQDVAVSGLKAFNDGLDDAILKSQNLGQVFENTALTIVSGLVKIGIQQEITKPLANLLFGDGSSTGGGIFSGLGGLFGGGSGASSSSGSGSGGPTGGVGGSIIGDVTGFLKAIPLFGGFFAGGGSIGAGQWGIAGENGPEPVFGGSTGATVFPNSSLGGMGAKAQVVQPVVQISTSIDASGSILSAEVFDRINRAHDSAIATAVSTAIPAAMSAVSSSSRKSSRQALA